MTALPLCSVCGYVGMELGLCEAIYSCVHGCGSGSDVRRRGRRDFTGWFEIQSGLVDVIPPHFIPETRSVVM